MTPEEHLRKTHEAIVNALLRIIDDINQRRKEEGQ